MKHTPINFKDKLDQLSDFWSPRIIAVMNDYEFKLAKIQGEFVWHNHPDTDEVFIVIDGVMNIEFHDGVIKLGAGEMFVVPSGVEHRTTAENECQILLVTPRGTVNTGDAGGDLTAPNDVWL